MTTTFPKAHCFWCDTEIRVTASFEVSNDMGGWPRRTTTCANCGRKLILEFFVGVNTYHAAEDEEDWLERCRKLEREWNRVDSTAPHKSRVGPKRGHVYFVGSGDGGPIKIGFTTKHPDERCRALQTSSPNKLEVLCSFSGTEEDEREVHRWLSEHRLNGEWFEDCEFVRATMRRCCG